MSTLNRGTKKRFAKYHQYSPGERVKLTSGEVVTVKKKIREGANYRIEYDGSGYLIHHDHISHAVNEEAPVNAIGAGNIAGSGGEGGEPGVSRSAKKRYTSLKLIKRR